VKRRVLIFSAIAAVACHANVAFADLVAPRDAGDRNTPAMVDVSDASVVSFEASWSYGGVASSESPAIRELPPAPDSTTLVLTALLSAGVWQAGRSARHIHIGHLPDWYHAGAPSQIGHVVVFDLDFCAIAEAGPYDVAPVLSSFMPPERQFVHQPFDFSPSVSPRAPPRG